MWMLFYDENVATAWDLLRKAYFDKTIPGLIRLSCTTQPSNNAQIIFCFVGPSDNQEHCCAVGRRILKITKYSKQKCQSTFSSFIFYKRPKMHGHLYAEGFE